MTGAAPASAIVLLVPELEPLVGRWRAEYDPAARQGVAAHVTLLFPFKPPASITAEDVAELRAFFASQRLPLLEFGGVCAFRNLLYLPPEPSPAVSTIISTLSARLPEHPPYAGSIAVDDIVPHATVAYTESSDQQASIAEAFCTACEGRLPVTAHVREATLLVQDEAGAYRVRDVFPFGT